MKRETSLQVYTNIYEETHKRKGEKKACTRVERDTHTHTREE